MNADPHGDAEVDDPHPDEDGRACDSGGEEDVANDDGFGGLLRDYYPDAMSGRVGSSFSVLGGGDEHRHRVVQRLALRPILLVVRSCRARD